MVMIEKDKINGIPMKRGRTVFVTPADYACLYDHCQGHKTYVEIGTMFGASAIVAGYGVTGDVHCIDPFGVKGQQARAEQVSGSLVKPEYVTENWILHHDPERLHIHKQRHPPWPAEIKFHMFDVGLIDGCHDAPNVWADWAGMKQHVKHKILFHDVCYKGKGWDKESEAERNAGEVFTTIVNTQDEWKLVEVRGKMGVLERA